MFSFNAFNIWLRINSIGAGDDFLRFIDVSKFSLHSKSKKKPQSLLVELGLYIIVDLINILIAFVRRRKISAMHPFVSNFGI